MNTDANDLTRSAPHARPLEGSLSGLWPTAAWTTEERLERIAKMGQRVNGYVEFMINISSLNGSSIEAKDKAVAAFYECLLTLEQRLKRIQERLQLQ